MEVFFKTTNQWSKFEKGSFQFMIPPGDRQEYFYLIREDSLYGYIDFKGDMIFEPQFNSGLPFLEGVAVIEKGNGNWGIISMDKKITWVKAQFTNLLSFKNGLAIAEMDMRGELADYERTEHLENIRRLNPDREYEYQMIEILCGIIDRKGNELVPLKYFIPEKDSWDGNFLYYYDEWQYQGAIGIDGAVILPCIYRSIEITADRYILTYRKDEESYFEISNNKLIRITQQQYGKGIDNIKGNNRAGSTKTSSDDLPF